jgi:mono/diheme cytochrome c family protein
MRKEVVFLVILVGSAAGAVAQQSPPAQQSQTVPFASRGAIGSLTDQQTQGLELFNQSCQVCHTEATLNSALWGPALSVNTLGGDATKIHDEIANGDGTLMPAWKYKYSSAQIDAIVAYIKTMAQITLPSRPVTGGSAD